LTRVVGFSSDHNLNFQFNSVSFLNWLDHRTGFRAFLHEALYERIPGGARWRYVWGSTLVFAFFVQVVTGIFLWMMYSPSAQTAWESVYYIQNQTQGGWLLRGVHHFMSQAMVVLMAVHLLQVIIDGAYGAPREVNFWLGLILMLIVLGLSLTGYLLPWDQKGYWATRVATNLLSIVPIIGKDLQQLVVGGPDYGHHTLTRFFALHAGLLPALLVFFLVLHVALFRRHGITARQPLKRAEQTFWPEQVLRDSVASFAVMAIVLLLAIHFDIAGFIHGTLSPENAGADLAAPADPAAPYDARPEWYFLFLFQFLKLFEGMGQTGEFLGAIVIPSLVLLVLFLMPFIGRSKIGHRFNIAFVVALLVCIAALTGLALREDYRARWTDAAQFAEIAELSKQLGRDEQRISAHFQGDATKIRSYRKLLSEYEAYRKSATFLAGVKQAKADARRARELAAGPTLIPPEGAVSLLRNDALTQGPRLFAQYCASCHSYLAPGEIDSPEGKQQLANASAPNLHGFGSRTWIAGLLNPKQITSHEYFGATTRYKELKAKDKSMEMIDYVLGDLREWPNEEVEQVVAALSAQAKLPSQRGADQKDSESIAAGTKHIADDSRCAACHRFKPELQWSNPALQVNESGYPDLTHYASRDWLIGMISNPAAPRFYGDKNDRMPAFAVDEGDGSKNILTQQQIELLVDWLRGDYAPHKDD
jgi:ubiquinol-cytochrome c reductase cytochrome b subunit